MRKFITIFGLIVFLFFPTTNYSGVMDEIWTHKFEAFDSGDIDYFLVNFNRFTDKFTQFIGNLTLEEAIDRLDSGFHDALDCAATTLAKQAGIEIKDTFRNYSIQRTDAEKWCVESKITVVPGTGGLASNFDYQKCIRDYYIHRNTYTFKSISNSYLGLKEIAKADVCGNKSNPESVGFKRAKSNYGYAGVRAAVWNDISKLENCTTSNNLKDCATRYVISTQEKAKKYQPIDVAIKYNHISGLVEQLNSHQSFGPVDTDVNFIIDWWFGKTERAIKNNQSIFSSYEKAAVTAYRTVELAETNRVVRKRKLEKTLNDFDQQQKALPSRWLCREHNEHYINVINALIGLANQCQSWESNPEFAGLFNSAILNRSRPACNNVRDRSIQLKNLWDDCHKPVEKEFRGSGGYRDF
ncbi:MAG: hypothetical protein AB2745_14240 [Candidatus Thiodiazotropha endolucinida]